MSGVWQISAGQLSEMARPALFALAVALSALVLADALRLLRPAAALAWALSSLLLPHVVAPLYFAARLLSARPRAPEGQGRRRWLLPLAYAAVLLAAWAIYFYVDYGSVEARLMRAKNARLYGRGERALAEYRAALAAGEDAHTRKLLGLELYEAGRWDEALAELREAERLGEPDEALPHHIAATLDKLGRGGEAADEYRRFLAGGLCRATRPDPRCESARGYAPPDVTQEAR